MEIRLLSRKTLVGVLATCAISLLVASTAEAKQFELVVTGKSVEIRVQPSPTARVVGKASRDDRFPALGPSKDRRWIKIRYQGRDAWVTSAKNSVNVREVQAAAPADKGGKFATVTANSIVRLEPKKRAPTVALVSRGDFLVFGGFSEDKKYVRVRTAKGESGWIEKGNVVPGRREDIRPAGGPLPGPGGPVVVRERNHPAREAEVVPIFGYLIQDVSTDPAGGNFKYKVSSGAPGAQIWVNWNLKDNFAGGFLDFRGGYMVASPGDIPAPNQDPDEPVLLGAMVHRLDLGARYIRPMGKFDLVAGGGYRFHLVHIQPQTLSHFFSNHYHTLNVNAGLRVPIGAKMEVGATLGVLPGLLIEAFGDGQSGSSGDGGLALGYEGNLTYTYSGLPAGLTAGVSLGISAYSTQFSGVGRRAGSDFDNALVKDTLLAAGAVIRRSF